VNLVAQASVPVIILNHHLDAQKTQRAEEKIILALTCEYKKTVLSRLQRDPKFARALYAEAINALLEGETAIGLSALRDLVHASITFKELARQTGYGEKALHRMLSERGNPTTRSLTTIIRAIQQDLKIAPRVKV
jgi:DNA-binding phage protein